VATVCDENDVIATVLDAVFDMTEVAKHPSAVLHACSEPSEQSLKLFSLTGAQKLNRISAVALPEFKCTDSAIRRPAVLAVVQGVTVVEERVAIHQSPRS
jgi:hypothetical protein